MPNFVTITPSAVVLGQLGSLRPVGGEVAGRVTREHVRGPSAASLLPRPDHHRVAVDRGAVAEFGPYGAVVRSQLGALQKHRDDARRRVNGGALNARSLTHEQITGVARRCAGLPVHEDRCAVADVAVGDGCGRVAHRAQLHVLHVHAVIVALLLEAQGRAEAVRRRRERRGLDPLVQPAVARAAPARMR